MSHPRRQREQHADRYTLVKLKQEDRTIQIKAAGIGAEASRQPACHGRHDAVDRVREAGGAVHQHYGRVDGLVNHAGRSYAASVEERSSPP